MPRGSKEDIMKYPIPVPPLTWQARIVEILDNLDTLTNPSLKVFRVKSSCARNNTNTTVIYRSVSPKPETVSN